MGFGGAVGCGVHDPFFGQTLGRLSPSKDDFMGRVGALALKASEGLTRPGGNADWRPTIDLATKWYNLGARTIYSWKRNPSLRIGAQWPRHSVIYGTFRNSECLVTAKAKKEGGGTEGSSEDATRPPFSFRELGLLLASSDFRLQVAIFIFAAGFVDAGFSGDWSRIGVLSKETEGDLQMAAVGVVPLAATLIWSISQRRKLL